jgi:hypothetical protein
VEYWREVIDYPKYEVSNYGRVWNLDKGVEFFPNVIKGYYRMNWRNDYGRIKGLSLHRVVLDAFVGPHPDLDINHIDGDKSNNRLDNLEFLSHAENMRHLAESRWMKRPGPKGYKVRILETGDVFRSVTACAKEIQCEPNYIFQCLAGERDSHKGCTFEALL